MLIAGKEFPENAAGYRDAADHVWSLSPAFEQDGYELLRCARELEDANRLRRWVGAGLIVAGLVWLAWKLST